MIQTLNSLVVRKELFTIKGYCRRQIIKKGLSYRNYENGLIVAKMESAIMGTLVILAVWTEDANIISIQT